MDTTFHFSSPQEISEDFITKLKSLYQGTPISIIVKENSEITAAQKEEVKKRQSYVKNHPESLVDFDKMMRTLAQELQNEG